MTNLFSEETIAVRELPKGKFQEIVERGDVWSKLTDRRVSDEALGALPLSISENAFRDHLMKRLTKLLHKAGDCLEGDKIEFEYMKPVNNIGNNWQRKIKITSNTDAIYVGIVKSTNNMFGCQIVSLADLDGKPFVKPLTYGFARN